MPKIRDIYISRRLNLQPYETLQLGISIVPEEEDGIIDLIRHGKQNMAHMLAELKIVDDIINWDSTVQITYEDEKDDIDDLL